MIFTQRLMQNTLGLFTILTLSLPAFARQQGVDGFWEMDTTQKITCSNGAAVPSAIQQAFFMRYGQTQLFISGKRVEKFWTTPPPTEEFIAVEYPLIVEYNKIILRHRGTTIPDAELTPVGGYLEYRAEDYEWDLCASANGRGKYRVVFRYLRPLP